MDISKSACCPPADFGLPTEEDMGKISRYAKKKLTPEEVFVFGVTLCDNDIDRDWERFTEECIEELAPLMSRLHLQQTTIHRQLKDLERQRMELEAVTENMAEGLLL